MSRVSSDKINTLRSRPEPLDRPEYVWPGGLSFANAEYYFAKVAVAPRSPASLPGRLRSSSCHESRSPTESTANHADVPNCTGENPPARFQIAAARRPLRSK